MQENNGKRGKGRPRPISRRDFALGSVAAIGTAVTGASARPAIPPLSPQARGMKLEKSGDVEDLLEDRHILDEDIRRVIQAAESSGKKLYQPNSDRLLSKLEMGEATFYVEYSPIPGGYRVHSAYTHRFELQED